MSSRDNRPGEADGLRKRAEEIALEKEALSPENIAALSPEALREKLHELRVHQIELEMLNEELRQSQSGINATRAHYLNLYDFAPFCYCTISEKGLILEANLTAATLLGVAREELLKQPISRFIHKEDQGIYDLHCKKLFETGKPQVCDLRIVKNDGATLWANLVATADRETDSAPLCRIVMSDITARKQVERHLRESESLLSSIFRAAPTGIGVVSNRILLAVNDRLCDMIGYRRDEMIGQSARMLYPNDAQFEYVGTEKYRQILQSGTGTVETLWQCKDGRIIDILMSSTPINPMDLAAGVTFTALDITESKKAASALRKSEELFRNLFERHSAIMLILDPDTGKIIDANKSAASFYGWSIEKLRQICIQDINALSPEAVKREMEKVVFSESARLEFRHRRADGSIRDVEVFSNKIDIAGKAFLYSIVHDITDRKRAEAQKAKLEDQNRQFQKEESLGRMAGAIAHHFNNQLHVVMGNLEMAMTGLPLGANPFENLIAATQAAQKAAEVSGLMLTYLGQTPGKHEPLDLSEICSQSLPMLQAAAPKGTFLKADFPPIDLVIRANAGQIIQVLTNLAANAWESADENRSGIGLTVKTVSHADILPLRCVPIDWLPRDTDYACLEVADAGCGIAEKDFEKIFDPFFTTKFTGRGLGLSVVLGIVRTHGGAVAVESKPGLGSIFRVFFPISIEKVPRHLDIDTWTAETEGGGTVLLIEDDDQVRAMVKTMLTLLGYTVLEAGDGIEAVAVFRRHSDEIRCVVCDLSMPRMDGWETLTALRGLVPGIPFVLTSGYDKEFAMAGDHTEMPQAFLKKPYPFEELRDSIRQSLAAKKEPIVHGNIPGQTGPKRKGSKGKP